LIALKINFIELFTMNISNKSHNQAEIYLQVQLTPDTRAAIPVADSIYGKENQSYQLQEVLNLNLDRLTPMPNMPPWVMGLLNQRSRIFWVVDLAEFLGFSALDNEEQNQACAIIKSQRISIGFGVQKIGGILRLRSEQIQSPLGTFSPHLEPYLRGCLPLKNELLLILDPTTLVQRISQSVISQLEAVS
jgi:positive phototaxis protein PixI